MMPDTIIQDFEGEISIETVNALKRGGSNLELVRLTVKWLQTQELCLLLARDMSPEKARAVLVGFVVNELDRWMVRGGLGPLLSILALYDGPLSDEAF